MGEIALLLACLGFGLASSLMPILNAEAYLAINIAAADESLSWTLVLLMTVGTVVGKMMIFWGVRSGKKVVKSKVEERAGYLSADQSEHEGDVDTRRFAKTRRTVNRWSRRLLQFLADPWKGTLTVFVSSVVGIPPLAVVAFLAGASKQNIWLFSAAVFVGRGIRFGAVAVPVLYFS